jgi:hypothetical protein
MKLLIAMALAVLPATLLAQRGAPAAPAANIEPAPKMPDGKPDLSGVYQGSTRRGKEWDAEAPSGEQIGVAAPRRPGDVAPPPREPIPFTDAARKQAQEFLNRRSIDDPQARCLPQPSPRTTASGLFPTQFVQNAHDLVILYEYFDEARVIPIDGRGHPDDIEPSWKGDSVGHWEGNTLVVDVIGFKGGGWLASGVQHTDKLHMTERYTRVDKDQLNYEVTMDDPGIFTKPWTMRATLMLREGTHLREYACVENNQDVDRYEKLLTTNPSSFMRTPDAAGRGRGAAGGR